MNKLKKILIFSFFLQYGIIMHATEDVNHHMVHATYITDPQELLKDETKQIYNYNTVIIAFVNPCNKQISQVCFDKSQYNNGTHDWGNATIPDKVAQKIASLHAKGIKFLAGLGILSPQFPKFRNDHELLFKFLKNLSLFVNRYHLDGVDLDYEGESLSSKTVNFLNNYCTLLRSFLPSGVISLTVAFYYLFNSKLDNFFNYKVNSHILNQINWITIMYYDVGSIKNLEPKNIIKKYEKILSTYNLPSQKLVFGFALGSNDTGDVISLPPVYLINNVIFPLLNKYHNNFGGVMGWRFLNNNYYGENWGLLIKNIFTISSKHQEWDLTDASMSEDGKLINIPNQELIYIKNRGQKIKWINIAPDLYKYPTPKEKVIFAHTKQCYLLLGEISKAAMYSCNFDTNDSVKWRIVKPKNLNENFGGLVYEINNTVASTNNIYLLTNAGVFEGTLDASTNKLIWSFVGFFNKEDGGYTSFIYNGHNVYGTLPGNQGVYQMIDSHNWTAKNNNLPKHRGEVIIYKLQNYGSCLIAKSDYDIDYISIDDGESWNTLPTKPTYFNCAK